MYDESSLKRAAFGCTFGRSLHICSRLRRHAWSVTSYLRHHGALPVTMDEDHATDSLHTHTHHHLKNEVASEITKIKLTHSPAPPPTKRYAADDDASA